MTGTGNHRGDGAGAAPGATKAEWPRYSIQFGERRGNRPAICVARGDGAHPPAVYVCKAQIKNIPVRGAGTCRRFSGSTGQEPSVDCDRVKKARASLELAEKDRRCHVGVVTDLAKAGRGHARPLLPAFIPSLRRTTSPGYEAKLSSANAAFFFQLARGRSSGPARPKVSSSENVSWSPRRRNASARQAFCTQIGKRPDSGEVLALLASRQKIREALGLAVPNNGGQP